MKSTLKGARQKRQQRTDAMAPQSGPVVHNAIAGSSSTPVTDNVRRQYIHQCNPYPAAMSQPHSAMSVPPAQVSTLEYASAHMAQATRVGPHGAYLAAPSGVSAAHHHQYHHPHMNSYAAPPVSPQDQLLLRLLQDLGGALAELKTEVSTSRNATLTKLEALEATVTAEKESNVALCDQFRAFANAQAVLNRKWGAIFDHIKVQIGKGEDETPLMKRIEAMSFSFGDIWEKVTDPCADNAAKTRQRERLSSPAKRLPAESSSSTKVADPVQEEASGPVSTPSPQGPTTSTTLNDGHEDLGKQLENILNKPPKETVSGTGASTPLSQIDGSEMDFAYPPDIEILSETEEQPHEPAADLEVPACFLPVTNKQTRVPCKEGSFSKVDWNAPVHDEDEDSTSESPVPYFRPNLSPEILRNSASYTSEVAEGSVAQLRLETLGESSFMGDQAAASSTPPAQTIPLVAPPEVPPLPSPASSRSTSPRKVNDTQATDFHEPAPSFLGADDVVEKDAEMDQDDVAQRSEGLHQSEPEQPSKEMEQDEPEEPPVEMHQEEPAQRMEEIEQGKPVEPLQDAIGPAAPISEAAKMPSVTSTIEEEYMIPTGGDDVEDAAPAGVDEEEEDDHDELDMLPRKSRLSLPGIPVQPVTAEATSVRRTQSPSPAGTPLFLPSTTTPSAVASRRGTPYPMATESTAEPDDDQEHDIDKEELVKALELPVHGSSLVIASPASSPTKLASRTSSPAKLSPILGVTNLSFPTKLRHPSSSSDASRIQDDLLAASSPVPSSDIDENEDAHATRLSMQPPSQSQGSVHTPQSQPSTTAQEEMLPSPPASDTEYPVEDDTEVAIQLPLSRSVTPIPQKQSSSPSPLSPEIPLPHLADFVVGGQASPICSASPKKVEHGRSPSKAQVQENGPPDQDTQMDDDERESNDEAPVVHSKSVSRSPSKRTSRNIVTSPSPERDPTPEVPLSSLFLASRSNIFAPSPVAVTRTLSSRSRAALPTPVAPIASSSRLSAAPSPLAAVPSSPRLSPPPQIKAEPMSRFPNTKSEKLPNTPRRPPVADVIEILSSPEASPRVDLQMKVNKIREKAKARAKAKAGRVSRPSMTTSVSSRTTTVPPTTQAEPVIDLTLTSESEAVKSGDEDAMPVPAKAKSVQEDSADEEDEEANSSDLGDDSDTSTEFIRPKKTSLSKPTAQAAPKKPLNLKDTVRNGESLAATKIKKRKPKPAGEDDLDDRPLKKARDNIIADKKGKGKLLRPSTSKLAITSPRKKSPSAAPANGYGSVDVKRERVSQVLPKSTSRTPGPSLQKSGPDSASSSKRVSSSLSSKSSSQKNDRQLRDKKAVRWPTPIRDGVADGSIQCDKCQNWYHYGCVKLDEDDLDVLDDDTPYHCPACSVDLAPSRYLNPKRKGSCARPGCTNQKRTKDGEYFVKAIVGRAPAATQGEVHYLVEWKDYAIAEATWEPSVPNPLPFLRKFEARAKKEGLDLSNPHATILLAEARPHHS